MKLQPPPLRLVPWLLLLLALGQVACEEPAQVIEVLIEGADAAALRSVELELEVVPEGGGQPIAVPDERLLRRLDRFVLRLSAGQRGELLVRVAGLDQAGCQISAGEARVLLGIHQYLSLSVKLGPTEPGCLLRVLRLGPEEGRVISTNVPGIDCPGRCAASFPRGQEVMLSAQGTPAGTYFAGWSGACTGVGACVVAVGSKTSELTAHFAPRQICSDTGWCWERPRPQGNRLTDVWGSSRSDIWAVGDSGTLLHYAGSAWTPVRLGVTDSLRGIWGSATDDVWVAGQDGILLRWNGRSWTRMESGTTAGLTAIHGVFPKGGAGPPTAENPLHLWAVAVLGGAFHWRWDGAVLTPMGGGQVIGDEEPVLADIWGSAPDDLWAVGARQDLSVGIILHFDGSAWQVMRKPETPIGGVWGSQRDDVWFVGDGGSVLRFDGRSFQEIESGTTSSFLDIFGTGPDDVWAVGTLGAAYHFRRDGSYQIFSGNTRRTFFAAWGAGPDEYWAVGTSGMMSRWNGAFWAAAGVGTEETLNAISGTGANDVWAVGEEGNYVHFNGRTWIPGRFRNFEVQPWVAITPIRPGEVWLAGAFGALLRASGTGSAGFELPLGLKAVWTASTGGDKDLWVVGREFSAMGPNPPSTLAHVVWSEAKQVFEVDKQLTVPFAISALWGSGPADLWAVGHEVDGNQRSFARVLHGDGNDFTVDNLPVEEPLLAVWGSGPRDVWIGGGTATAAGLLDRGVLLHYAGSSFAVFELNRPVRQIWGTGPGDIWAVGDVGLVLHHDGASWQDQDIGFQGHLTGVWGTRDGKQVFITGLDGAILRRQR